MNLLSLPTEILTTIFLHLGVADSYALQSVNRLFRALYQSSLALQYALECQIASVDDNPRCQLSITLRLQMLRDRESAWRSLESTSRKTVPIPYESSTHYDMTRSHFCLGKSLPKRSPLSLTPFADGVQFYSIQMPGEGSWSVVHTDRLVDFGCCIDEHDLIACVSRVPKEGSLLELQVHLFQHSTGSRHPLTTKPVIPLCRENVPQVEEHIIVAIEIVGEVLVVCVEAASAFKWMYVLHWKTGEHICDPIPISNPDLAVLHQDLIINSNIEGQCLDIYYIPQVFRGEGCRRIQRLRLPKMLEGVLIHTFRCRAAPNPTGDGLFPKYVPASVPFVDRPENAIILFRLDAELDLDWHDFAMLVHRYSILDTLPPSDYWPTMPCRTLEWEDWGPSVTSWVECDDVLSTDITTSNGQRHVLHGLSAISEGGSAPLVVQDFNPHNIRCVSENARGRVQLGSVLKHPLFREPITFELPCAEITSAEKYPYSGVSISDNAIIGTNNSFPLSIDALHFV